MSWFGRLIGRDPPRVPPGCVARVVMDGDCWRVEAIGQCRSKRLSPTFVHQTTAYAYLDWIENPHDPAKRFTYPTGVA